MPRANNRRRNLKKLHAQKPVKTQQLLAHPNRNHKNRSANRPDQSASHHHRQQRNHNKIQQKRQNRNLIIIHDYQRQHPKINTYTDEQPLNKPVHPSSRPLLQPAKTVMIKNQLIQLHSRYHSHNRTKTHKHPTCSKALRIYNYHDQKSLHHTGWQIRHPTKDKCQPGYT